MALIPAEEDLYGGSPAEAQMPEEMDAGMQESAESETAVLPTSILMGKNVEPGDSVILRVVRIGDGELEVAYDTEAGGEEEMGEEMMAPAGASEELYA